MAQDTREAAIRAQERSKENEVLNQRLKTLEAKFARADRAVTRYQEGFGGIGIKLGGLVTSSGFGLGPQFTRPEFLGTPYTLRATARASVRKYYLLEVQLTAPRLVSTKHVFSEIYLGRHDYPSMDFYGEGSNSAKGSRVNYRFEDMLYRFGLGVHPVRKASVSGDVQYQMINVGPGQREQIASIEKVFTEATAPGSQFQTSYLRYGATAQYDYRDIAGDPHRGGNYLLSYHQYDDMDLQTASFQRLTAEVQQYVPFLNGTRVFVIRGRTDLSYHGAGVRVPFYMQPAIGGADNLRGYRAFRFYDENSLVLNAEYRWTVMTGLDMALFADGGDVFHRPGAISLHNLKGSGGFGVRAKTRETVVMRIDVGFSREGLGAWLKFNNIF